jgi:hypothetical protein
VWVWEGEEEESRWFVEQIGGSGTRAKAESHCVTTANVLATTAHVGADCESPIEKEQA